MPQKLDFITPTVMRALEFFFGDPRGEYHEREVMRKVGMSKGSANRILRLLAKNDFLERARRGRIIFYKLNTENVAVRQFKTLSNIYRLKELTDRLSENSKRIILFGSCAEGADEKESDIDLFILTDQKSEAREIINRYEKSINKKISPIIVTASEFIKLRSKDKPLYARIVKGITLWQVE